MMHAPWETKAGLLENVRGFERVMDEVVPVLEANLPERLVCLEPLCLFCWPVWPLLCFCDQFPCSVRPRYSIEIMEVNPRLV